MWLTQWRLSAVPSVQHREKEWLVNNELEASERFGRELIWFAIAEFVCRDWQEPRGQSQLAKIFEPGDSVNKKPDC